jgi:hypothetical protein
MPIILPDDWRSGQLVPLRAEIPGFLLRSEEDHVRLAWVQESTWHVSPPATQVGDLHFLFADGAGDTVNVLASFVTSSTGGSAALNGWTSWAEYRNGEWAWEEKAARWNQCYASGLTTWRGDAYALMSCLSGWTLHRRSGTTWTSEALPSLSKFGVFGLTSNTTTLTIVAQAASGAVVAMQRKDVGQPFETTILQASGSLAVGSIWGYAQAARNGSPMLVWWHNAVSAPGAPEAVRGFAAIESNGAWQTMTAGPAFHTPRELGADQTGFVMRLQDENTGGGVFWRFDGQQWSACPRLTPEGLAILTAALQTRGDGLALAYSDAERLSATPLDALQAACVEGSTTSGFTTQSGV